MRRHSTTPQSPQQLILNQSLDVDNSQKFYSPQTLKKVYNFNIKCFIHT